MPNEKRDFPAEKEISRMHPDREKTLLRSTSGVGLLSHRARPLLALMGQENSTPAQKERSCTDRWETVTQCVGRHVVAEGPDIYNLYTHEIALE